MRRTKKAFTAVSVLAAVAVAVAISACGSSKIGDTVLKIDGVEVPFTEGESAVAEALGNKYCRWINFIYPRGAVPAEVCLKLAYLEDREDTNVWLYNYVLNENEGDLGAHDIQFLGFDTYHVPIDDLKEKYGDYFINDAVSDYELYVVDGHIVGTADPPDEINSYMIIDIFESEEHTTESIIFTVVEKK